MAVEITAISIAQEKFACPVGIASARPRPFQDEKRLSSGKERGRAEAVPTLACSSFYFTDAIINQIQLNDNIFVARIQLPPDVKHNGQQEYDAQHSKLREFIGKSAELCAGNRRIGRNENEVAGNCGIRQWQQSHNPRA